MSPPAFSLKTSTNFPPPTLSLQGNNTLHISGTAPGGGQKSATLNLDSILGNSNGAMSLGATGFASNAKSVQIKQLTKYTHAIDAEIPDANGHVSTSSMTITAKVGSVQGQNRLLMAWQVPHSTAHAESSSTDEADSKVLSQLQGQPGGLNVQRVVTMNIDPKYNMSNPNKEWVKQNLGPHGSSDSSEIAKGALEGGVEAGMDALADCVLM